MKIDPAHLLINRLDNLPRRELTPFVVGTRVADRLIRELEYGICHCPAHVSNKDVSRTASAYPAVDDAVSANAA
jgi:hypothetical protein